MCHFYYKQSIKKDMKNLSVTNDLKIENLKGPVNKCIIKKFILKDHKKKEDEKTVNLYNTKGMITEMMRYDYLGELANHQISEYDNNGNKVLFKNLDEYGDIESYGRLIYDKHNRKIGKLFNGEIYEHYLYTGNEHNISSTLCPTSKNETKFYYDDFGFVKETITDPSHEDIKQHKLFKQSLTNRVLYKTDNFGNILSQQFYDYFSNELFVEIRNQVNQYGDIIESTYYKFPTKAFDNNYFRKYDYAYDQYKNWITCNIQNYSNQAVEIMEREITYS